MHACLALLICLGVVIAPGCEGDSDKQAKAAEPASATTPAQDTVAWARAQFDPTAFDTIQFPSDRARLARGADVFRWACSSCHGLTGRGDGGAVLNGDTLHPPSFLEPNWRFAHDENGLRRQIFVGNARGMPHWGLRGTQLRDIVAVETYILQGLRSTQ
jgi:mono/diheme cytochrome c family protein